MTKRLALLSIPLAMFWSGGSARAAQSAPPPPAQAQQAPSPSTTPAAPATAATPPAPAGNTHTIDVKFDYNFKKNRPCSEKETKDTCIKQFNVYDISGGMFKLFTIPAPADAKGEVKGIGGTSPPRVFEPGTHFIAVTAENAAGVQSSMGLCQTWVQIPAPSPAPAAPVQASAPAKP